MPVYSCKIKGEDKVRLVKAASAAQARTHLVEAETVSAEELADALEGGATIEKATAPAEPETKPEPAKETPKGGDGDGPK
jgi:hypothetical protein